MKSEIIKEVANPFLERKEILVRINSEVTPSITDFKKVCGKDEELTIIKRINSNFGDHTFTAEVLIYDNKTAKKNIEIIPKKVRKKMEAEEKAEEKAKKDAEKKAIEESKKEIPKKVEETPSLEKDETETNKTSDKEVKETKA